MAKRRKHLNDEDRILWQRVTDSITPLPVRARKIAPSAAILSQSMRKSVLLKQPGPSPKKAAPVVNRPSKPGIALQPRAEPVRHNPFDNKTRRKIAKGRLPIDGRIDLHGMTQDQAITVLRDFLYMARASNYRLVLVITGKGASGQGILRRRVPDWLGVGDLASIVSSVEEAHFGHGGSGALYVRLKRS